MILRPAQDEQGFVLMPGTAKPYPGLRSEPFLVTRSSLLHLFQRHGQRRSELCRSGAAGFHTT